MTKDSKAARPRKSKVEFELAPVLGAQQGVQLHSRLAPLVNETPPVVLDASKVERVETLALQVLVTFVRARQTSGRETAWSGVSSEFRRATDLLGLSEMLGVPA